MLSFGDYPPKNEDGGGYCEVKEALCLSMLVPAHFVAFLAIASTRFHW